MRVYPAVITRDRQIDAHTRFAVGWDRTYIGMLKKCASAKPIITESPEAVAWLRRCTDR